MAPLASRPHRRYDPLRDEWILVSPHRTQRPWQGQVEDRPLEVLPTYDPSCYLCPGNVRANGDRNPAYEATFVYDNDFPALLADGQPTSIDDSGLLVAESERGICRVICFSPRHDLTLAGMATSDVRRVVDVWAEQTLDLGSHPFINHVQIFENRGAMMGSSNPHPHGQIWSNETVPELPRRELESQQRYLQERDSCLLCDYLQKERDIGVRVVAENEHFTALVPFWAVWPFETMVLSRRHVADVPSLEPAERDGLAHLFRYLTAHYDGLFRVPFPYSMGFHQAPTDLPPGGHPEWHLHAHFFPPLLRSATVRKFMVGYEMLANAQRDLTPEQAADRIRAVSEELHRASTHT
jgi:UDPglucose--hexose-1-phosphate uridylyltransferase